MLPDRTPRRGGRWRDHRQVIDAIAWKFPDRVAVGDLPAEYGSWKGVYTRLRKWAINGRVGSPAVPGGGIGAVEGLEVELLDRLDHESGEVVLGQPVAQVRGLQGCSSGWSRSHVRMFCGMPRWSKTAWNSKGLRDSLLENQVPELSTNPTISRYSILGGTP